MLLGMRIGLGMVVLRLAFGTGNEAPMASGSMFSRTRMKSALWSGSMYLAQDIVRNTIETNLSFSMVSMDLWSLYQAYASSDRGKCWEHVDGLHCVTVPRNMSV